MNIYSNSTHKPQHNLAIAQAYADSGLNLIPLRCDGSKAPKLKEWRQFQEQWFPVYNYPYWFGNARRLSGIAIVCGSTSGGLECSDFDDPACFPLWSKAVDAELPGLLESLPIVATPDDGRHVFYRSPAIEGNQVLARDQAGKVRIETRGQGGLVVAVGSPLSTHPTRKPYRLVSGNMFAIPTISIEQRQRLLDLARGFDSYQKPALPTRQPAVDRRSKQQAEMLRELYGIELAAADRPGDRFNDETTWEEILEDWTIVNVDRDGVFYWRKPGATAGHHATTGRNGGDNLYVFSTSVPGFEANRPYSKFAAYAILKHSGCFKSAAAALAKQFSFK